MSVRIFAMKDPLLELSLKWTFARVLCSPAVLMPYRLRVLYIQILSYSFHLPFLVFGRIARYLLDQLGVEANSENNTFKISPSKISKLAKLSSPSRRRASVAILYSGGTDSTCVAALCAQKFRQVHLLTFYEHATRNSPVPRRNINLLRKHFKDIKFMSRVISVDRLVKHFWYESYFERLKKHGFLALSTCGFSSLSWHVRTIIYCRQNNISYVADGLTRELMHFPGHMDEVVEQLRDFYREFGITYENPVRDWPTPPDQQFIDKLIVNNHGSEFFLGDENTGQRKTTGYYLFKLGLFPSPNVKGTKLDFSMQHDCYPFTLYNVMTFWGFLSTEPYELFQKRVSDIMKEKIGNAKALIAEYQKYPKTAPFAALLEQ